MQGGVERNPIQHRAQSAGWAFHRKRHKEIWETLGFPSLPLQVLLCQLSSQEKSHIQHFQPGIPAQTPGLCQQLSVVSPSGPPVNL